MQTTTALRQLLRQPGIIIAPGAYDCLTAKLIKYRASLARGNVLFFHANRCKEVNTYCRRAVLNNPTVGDYGAIA